MIVPPPPSYGQEFFSQKVLCLGQYHPYRIENERGEKVKNPAWDAFSGKVLDLKDEANSNHSAAVTYFASKLTTYLNRFDLPTQDLISVIVPSHSKDKWSKGLEDVLRQTHPANFTLKIEPKVLKRTSDIIKLTSGGNRSIDTHLSSINVDKPAMVRGKIVLLIDDVWTTGNSLRACRNLLLAAGAEFVVGVTLAKTTHEDTTV